MERPPADPAKLLEAWMEWERGETPPGRVMSTLKTGGLRDLLEDLVAALAASKTAVVVDVADREAAESWTPIV